MFPETVIFNPKNKVDYVEYLKKVILNKIFDNPFIPWKKIKMTCSSCLNLRFPDRHPSLRHVFIWKGPLFYHKCAVSPESVHSDLPPCIFTFNSILNNHFLFKNFYKYLWNNKIWNVPKFINQAFVVMIVW